MNGTHHNNYFLSVKCIALLLYINSLNFHTNENKTVEFFEEKVGEKLNLRFFIKK